jgi:hypothetical protein
MRRHAATRQYQRPNRGPGTVLKGNGLDHQIKGNPRPIVIAGFDHSTLREAAVSTYIDPSNGVEPYSLANPRVLTDRYIPGIFDIYAGLYHDTSAYVRPEKAE